MSGFSLGQIVSQLGGELFGDPEIRIARIAPLDSAGSGDVAFLSNPKYKAQLASTKASAVIVADPVDRCSFALIVTPNPYLYFARLSQWFHPVPQLTGAVHPTAVVEGDVDSTANVGAHAYIGPGALIGARAVIGPNCSVMAGARIGADTRLLAGVTVYEGCALGERCLVHAGAVIGSDGFGFAREHDGSWVKIPQTGRVIIGNDVEIGACTSIDRGAMADTVIGDGVKLDNQIQIAHNVTIGANTAIAGCVGIAGSTHIGARCTIGGAAMIIGHLTIVDDVHISSGTLIGKSIMKRGNFSGAVPFMEHGDWLQNFAKLRHLDAMAEKLKLLEQRLRLLEGEDE